MFRPDDLFKVLKLECALGGRRYGHFDHDAANITGPRGTQKRSSVLLQPDSAGVRFRKDPKTGEYLPNY